MDTFSLLILSIVGLGSTVSFVLASMAERGGREARRIPIRVGRASRRRVR